MRRATVKAMGMSSTKPTSKNAGRPTMRPMTIMAQGTRFSPKKRISVLRDLVGAAGLGHHLAQHGAQRHDDGDVAEGRAHARSQRNESRRQAACPRRRRAQRDEKERDEWIELEDGDEQDQANDRERARRQARRCCEDRSWARSVLKFDEWSVRKKGERVIVCAGPCRQRNRSRPCSRRPCWRRRRSAQADARRNTRLKTELNEEKSRGSSSQTPQRTTCSGP